MLDVGGAGVGVGMVGARMVGARMDVSSQEKSGETRFGAVHGYRPLRDIPTPDNKNGEQ